LNDEELDASHLALPPQAGQCNAELCRVVLAMKDEMDNPGPVGNLYRTTLAVQLLIRLVRSTCHLTLPPAKGGLPAWRLRRVLEMLEADLTAAPSVSQLASVAGLSPAHFCTAFKQSTGYSPHRYLLNRRIAHAKELMADRRLSLTEVALTCGFGSCGLPPSLEAAATQAMGGSVCGPDAAAAASARRGGTAAGRTTTMAGTSVRLQGRAVGGSE
jgi:AraC family transcriptional regulator